MSADDTRDRLLDAVATELTRVGPGALSLRRVARLAGVSHAAPGALFGDKAGMLTAFATRGFERLAAAISAPIDTPDLSDWPAAPRRIVAVGRGYVAFALAEPAAFALMFRPEALSFDDAGLLAARDAAYGALNAAIAGAVASGHIAGERAEAVGLGAWSVVHGLVALVASGNLDRRLAGDALARATALAEQLTRDFVAGALATAGPDARLYSGTHTAHHAPPE